MKHKNTPLHQHWHKMVEGQINDCMAHHPKWFVFKDEADKETCVNSLAKRIVGEIVVAMVARCGNERSGVRTKCATMDKEG